MTAESHPPSQGPTPPFFAPHTASQQNAQNFAQSKLPPNQNADQQDTLRLTGNPPPIYTSSTALVLSGSNKPIARTQNLPWYDRNTLADMTQFGPGKDGFAIILTPSAVEDLQKGTYDNAPNEAFGLLMGRTYMDNKGIFTVVSGAVYANRLNASPENFHLTAQEMREVRFIAGHIHPIADLVGWTHSHGVYSKYSQIDRIEQAKGTETYYIGILTFMQWKQKEPWAIAYHGPTSQELQLQKIAPQYDEGQAFVASYNQQDPKQPEHNLFRSKKTSTGKRAANISPIKQSTFNTGLLIVAFLCLLSISFIARGMLMRIDSNIAVLQSELHHLAPTSTSLTTATQAKPTSNFRWGCDIQNGEVPLKVQCDGPADPEWQWDFGDGTIQKAKSVSHTYLMPGTYTITLTVSSSGKVQKIGSLPITVTNPTIIQPTVVNQ